MSRSRLISIVFLAAALLRVPVALRHIDTWYPFEVHSGNIAMALLDGVSLDWRQLPIMQHVRGGVLFGFFQALSFKLLGPTAFALKLVPILWHAATLGLAAGLLDRFVSRRAAVTTALLLLFAPPLIGQLSTLGFASHLESMLPMLLATWPFLTITLEGRRGPRPFFLFGLATGFAGFFHLQAILPCLILVALLGLLETRRCFGRAGLAALLGLALGAGPSWLFADGNVAYLRWTMEGGGGAVATNPEASAASGDVQRPALDKLGEFVDGGLVEMMGFPKLAPESAPSDPTPGTAPLAAPRHSVSALSYTLLLLGAVLAGIWSQREGLAALGRRALFFKRETASPAALFVLHPLMVLVMSLLAKTSIQTVQTGIGFENRRMAPMLFSMLVLAGLGLSAAGLTRLRQLVLVLLVLISGAAFVNEVTPRSEWPPMPKGAHYEWFSAQLHHASSGDLRASWETIERVDFGDPRFAILRFRPPIGAGIFKDPDVLARETQIRARLPQPLAVWRAAGLGRLLFRQRKRVSLDELLAYAASLPELEAVALLHGFGAGVPSPRSSAASSLKAGIEAVGDYFGALPGRPGQLAAEGYGFQTGSVYDPYNPSRAPMLVPLIRALPMEQATFFARGFGWGYRQRFGRDVPEDLGRQAVLEHLPAALHAHFEDAYHARTLPAEAAVSEPTSD